MPMQAPTRNGAVVPGIPGGPGGPPGGPPPGPASGPIIPDAGVYGAETAAAQNAYNTAVANAAAQRNSLYNQYGLNNQGGVDPNNPYGEYEQMLNAQAGQFGADREDAASRNLGSGGLARQMESQDRRGANAQDFQFQQRANQVSQDYNAELQNALATQQGSNSQAYNDAMGTALQNMLTAMANGNYTAPGVGQPFTPVSKPPAHNKPPIHKRPSHPLRNPG